VRTRSSGWLALVAVGATMTLKVAPIWLWLRDRSPGRETIAAQASLSRAVPPSGP
jgi:hypothetical protein